MTKTRSGSAGYPPWDIPGTLPPLSAADKAEILKRFPPSKTPLDNEMLEKAAKAAEKDLGRVLKKAPMIYRCGVRSNQGAMHRCFLGAVIEIQGQWVWVQQRRFEEENCWYAEHVVKYLESLDAYANRRTIAIPEHQLLSDEVARTARDMVASGNEYELICAPIGVPRLFCGSNTEQDIDRGEGLHLRFLPIQELMEVPLSDALAVNCHHSSYHPTLMQVVQDMKARKTRYGSTIFITP